MCDEVKFLLKIDLIIFLLYIVTGIIEQEFAINTFGRLLGGFSGLTLGTYIPMM